MAKVSRVLVVTAHPDDAEWYAGGSSARLAREGAAVTYIICTEGEKGSYDPGTDPQALAARRKQEQKAACELLGVGQAIFLGHADGGLENSPALRRQLTALYRRERPDLLITFDPWKRYELHPDHLAAGRAAVEARLAARMPLFEPQMRAQGLGAWTIPELWLFNPEAPNHYVDVSETFALKLQALRLHESQNVWGEDSVQHLTKEARACGEQAGCAMAEAFHRIVIEGAIARG
ncbi:MAG: PIG-L family deacetylase [Chloroflexi bacterium]|nr:MAG: PIG-L family deacetylase [Chloroflexota bacterium]